MLATSARVHQFPGTVPALLAWAHGESERLPGFVACARSDATTLLHTIADGVTARNAATVRSAAQRLYALLAHFGVPQISTTAAMVEDLARSNDLGSAAPLVEELETILPTFWAYVAKKPWLRC